MSTLLSRHLEALEGCAAQLSEDQVQAWIRALRTPHANFTAAQSRQAHTLAGELQACWPGLCRQLAQALTTQIRQARVGQAPQFAPSRPAPLFALSDFALVDEAQAERDILIARLVQQVELQAEWELRELLGRVNCLAALDGLRRFELSNYPASPAVFARALCQLAQGLPFAPNQIELLMRVVGPTLGVTLKSQYAAWSRALAEQGAPAARYSLAASSPPAHERLAQLLSTPQLDPGLRSALESLRAPVRALAQAQGQSLALTGADPALALVEAIAELFDNHRPAHRSQSLALGLRPALSRLETRLSPQAADFVRALQEVQELAEQDVQQQLQEAAPTVRVLLQAEQEQCLLPCVQEQISEQLRRAPALSPLLLNLMTGAWAQAIAHSLATEGESAPASQRLMGTLDALILSLHRPKGEAERQRQVQELPTLIAQVQDCLRLLALPEAAQAPILDALMKTHRRLLFRSRTPPAVATATEIEWDDASFQAQAADHWQRSDTDLGQLPTVPLPLEEQGAASAWLEQLPIGSRCKVFLLGQWVTARLIWRSDNGKFFMFSSPLASGSHTMTRRALEKLRAAGLLTDLAPSLRSQTSPTHAAGPALSVE
ncbi:hypothetical protein HNQ51_001573 [Inhella inkyongensis]|uniref:DUF1631 family protein n=1 Tax=Inhella inkyongensis TaxID=392593 RepID=A0A840S725_9BURK|nr:DUF1631 family protein [Inhella inkyongensis]MBB5204259.1 hypothetical protein [Inhella inkyongensis]